MGRAAPGRGRKLAERSADNYPPFRLIAIPLERKDTRLGCLSVSAGLLLRTDKIAR